MIKKQIQKPVADTADYTKTALWCNTNKAVIEDKGDFYEVVALPEQTLEEVRAAKLAELVTVFEKASKTAHCLSSVGFEINADDTAARNISNLIVALEETDRETVYFCAYDNTFHAVTLPQLRAMRLEIIDNAEAIYQMKWILRNQINGAETIEELGAIAITFEMVGREEGESDGQTA